jgi:DNA-binding transcriptional ArsR family regulator
MTKSIFLEVMGNYPINKILDFLIVFKEFDYSKKDIAKNSRVSYATLKYLWKDLEDREIVKLTRKVGKAKLYKLNKESPVVKQIIKMYWVIIKDQNLNEKIALETN